MKTYKKNLPDGVKKVFTTERGVKVRILNKKYSLFLYIFAQ